MSLQILNTDEALTPGVDLWILPSTTFSGWTKRLDWPLNLQITKASHYQARKPAAELLTILQQNDMQFDSTTPEQKNLIIATQGLIPATTIVIVAGENWEAWVKSAVKVWQDLGKPLARFFLPSFAKWEKVKSAWPSVANAGSVQVVASEDGL